MSTNPVLPFGLTCPRALLDEALDDMGIGAADTALTDSCVTFADVAAAAPRLGAQADTLVEAVASRRAGYLEHALNDFAGHPPARMWGGLEPAYRNGQRFRLALVERASNVDDLRMKNNVPDAPRFDIDLRYLPMHPQEVAARGLTADAIGPWVRATAAGRTVRLCDPQGGRRLIKCDLSHVVMDRKPRPLDIAEANAALQSSDFVYAALAAFPSDTLAYLPEVAARTLPEHDTAALVRHDMAYPPAPPGTWHIPLYALWADATPLGTDRPLLLHALDAERGAPNDHASLEERFFERIINPIVSAAAHLFITLGCAHSAHGQNWRAEISPGGNLTGRIVLTDLNDLWEDPVIAAHNGLALEWSPAVHAAHQASREADIGGAFVDFVLYELLHRALSCFERDHGPDPRLRARANAVVRAAVMERRAIVDEFRSGPLKWFSETYLP